MLPVLCLSIVNIWIDISNMVRKDYHVSKEDMQKLYDFGNRSGFTKGYYEKHNGNDMITFQKPNHAKGNEALQEKVREEFCRGEIKEKINGNLILSQDSSAILDVTLGNLRYTACGDVVQPALKQPLSMEKYVRTWRKQETRRLSLRILPLR